MLTVGILDVVHVAADLISRRVNHRHVVFGVDEEIVVLAVPQTTEALGRASLRLVNRNAVFLRRFVFFLDDADGQLSDVLQLELSLASERGSELR